MNPVSRDHPLVIDREKSLGDFSLIPNEIIQTIFSHLGSKELGRCCLTSRAFRVLASDPCLWRPASAFGKKEWEIYFGDVGVEPPLPKKILEILKSPCPFFKDKNIEETHRLVLMPKSVDGLALTLNRLIQLIQNPANNGHAATYNYFNSSVRKVIGEREIEQSYWILMTTNVIPTSFDNPKKAELLQEHPGYFIPTALEASVCLFMEHVASGKQLFNGEPWAKSWAYTRCSDSIPGMGPILVGFGTIGLDLFSCGIAAVKRFYGPSF